MLSLWSNSANVSFQKVKRSPFPRLLNLTQMNNIQVRRGRQCNNSDRLMESICGSKIKVSDFPRSGNLTDIRLYLLARYNLASKPLRTVAADCWGTSRAILYVRERLSFGLAGGAGQVDAQPAKVPLLAQGGEASGVCVHTRACERLCVSVCARACMW